MEFLQRLVALVFWAMIPGYSAAMDQLRFSGFASVTGTRADHEELGFRRDITQSEGSVDGEWRFDNDSLIGMQLNYRISDEWEAVTQVILKDRIHQSVNESIEWAFLQYRPNDSTDIRLGRLGLDLFMLADYRYVAYTYPWVRPVPDFYGVTPVFHFDGADFAHKWAIWEGSLRLKIFGGHSIGYFPTDDAELKLELSPLLGTTLVYEREPWRFRLSKTIVDLHSNHSNAELKSGLEAASTFWPEANTILNELSLEKAQVDYSAIGAMFDNNNWLLQAEWARIKGDRASTPQSKNWYVSIAYRWAEWTPFLLVAGASPDHPAHHVSLPPLPPQITQALEPLRQGSEIALNATRQDQRGYGLGLRWDFLPKRALKIQWDHWEIAANGRLLWITPMTGGNQDESVNVVSLSIDILF